MYETNKHFSSTEEESLEKYKIYKTTDPFPKILPALLSSGQIQAYIAKTGMVFPYSPSEKEERITQASLTMTIGPEVMYWDAKEKRQYTKTHKVGDEIIIRPNSITFLRPAERVNLPDYIAARFNLRIVHVHRGLLLGTGPLLDPGFKGYPMIPVHNLTDNEYRVQVGGEFISVEFTKIEIGNEWLEGHEKGQEPLYEYIQNSGKTFDYEFPQYIQRNVPHGRVKSSLSGVIDQAKAVVEKQKKVVEKQKKVVWVSFIGAAIAVGAFVIGGYALTLSATGIISDAKNSVNYYQKQEQEMIKLSRTVERLENEITELTKQKPEQNLVNTSTDSHQHVPAEANINNLSTKDNSR